MFAALDGVVIEVPVEHGQIVNKGDVLARLRNTDLKSAWPTSPASWLDTEEHIRLRGGR